MSVRLVNRPRAGRFGLGNLAALAAMVLLLPALGSAEVLIVEAGQKITPILERARPGDTVWLAPGEYKENLVIEVPITLTGEATPHIRGGFESTVIHVKAAGTVLRGLKVSEAGTQLMRDMACILIEADDVVVDEVEIEQPLHGIYVKGGNRIHITNNRILGRQDLIEEDRGNGIHVWNSKDNLIEGNEISYARDGIYFSFADSTRVVGNHIHDVRYGLHYMYSNHNVFEDNRFVRNVAGAALMYSSDITFLRNVFAHCRGFRSYGILYQSMQDTRASSNLVLDNSRGIFLNNSSGNLIAVNDVVDNDLAIQLNGDGGDNVIAGNNFIHNLSELLLDVGESMIEWSDAEGGNFWSDHKGYDLDGDGIGDRPYTIQNVFQVLESDYPEVRFYLFSLAAEILKLSERALPILELGKSKDPLPRMRASANPDVPWARAQTEYRQRSDLAAILYLVIAVVPISLLLYHSRVRRDSKP